MKYNILSSELKEGTMFDLKKEKSWVMAALLALVLFTLCVNIYAVLKYGDYLLLGDMNKMDNDDVKYIRTGIILLEKGMLVDLDVNKPTVAEMPGHGVMLAFMFKIFGYPEGVTVFRVVQSCIQALCIFLVFFIGREIYGSKVALIACGMSAVYLPHVVSSGLILMEVTYQFLLLLLVYISIFALKTKKLQYYIQGGVVWALACLVRPTLAMFPLIMLILWILYKYPVKEMIKYTLIVSIVFSLLLAPWWIRNYLDFNRFIPFSLASGNPFLQGTNINYDQSHDFMGYYPGKDAVETDRIEMETGIKRLKTYFKKQPMDYIYWYTIGKTKHLWRFPYYWKEIFTIPFNSVVRYHQFIMYMGILGAIISISGRKRRDSLMLILVIMYFTVIHLPYFTFARYAYPAMPIVIILAAYGAAAAVKYIVKGPEQVIGQLM